MKFLVAVKHVPDTETKIKVGADGVSIACDGVEERAHFAVSSSTPSIQP